MQLTIRQREIILALVAGNRIRTVSAASFSQSCVRKWKTLHCEIYPGKGIQNCLIRAKGVLRMMKLRLIEPDPGYARSDTHYRQTPKAVRLLHEEMKRRTRISKDGVVIAL